MTGGAGFIGSHLSELLLDEGWEVFALDDVSTGAHRNVERLLDHPKFHLVVESVLSSSVVSELVHKCDVVYHLAAAVGVRLIVEQPVLTMVTNVQGTEIVLEYCTKFRKRVLIASSSEVYGDHREERPLKEGDRRVYGPVTERRWLYADSKAMDEFLALAFHQERELDCVIARFFNTVGPRQQGQYGMVIPRFVTGALAGTPIQVHGDGMQTRSFCHVQDTIRAVHGLWRRPRPRARSSTSAQRSECASSTSRTRAAAHRRAGRSTRSTMSPPDRSRTSRICSERPDFHLVVESVLSPSVVSELVHKCDVVYHLAAASASS